MPHKKQFGQRVKELRESKKLSQEKFCQIADINQSNLSKIESGKKDVRLDTIYKIAKGLKVNIERLFDNIE